MKQSFKAMTSICVVFGCIMLLGSDNVLFGLMAVISFGIAAMSSAAVDVMTEHETELSNQWYECGQYPDY